MTERQQKLNQLEKLVAENPEAFASLTAEQQEKIKAAIASKDEPVRRRYPEKLVNRCECGRQISNHRFRCLACHTDFLREMGEQIESQDLLDALLERSAKGNEKQFLEQIRPYLKFEPASLS